MSPTSPSHAPSADARSGALSPGPVHDRYEALIASGAIERDPAQARLVRALDRLVLDLERRRRAKKGSALGWPWWCWVSLVASGAFGWAFWRTQQRLHRAGTPPLVPPPLLRLRSYRLGLVLALILMSGYGAFTYEYTLVTQTGLGWLPLHAALVTLPFALVFLGVSIASGRLVPRFGGRRILAVGGLVQLVGLVAIAVVSLVEAGDLGSISLGATMFVMGIGQAMMLGPLVGVILAQVPASSAGAGSGVFTTVQQGSLALGVAALGAVFIAVAAPGAGAVQASHFTTAFAVCLGIQAIGSIVFTITALRLPRTESPALS